MRLSLQLLIITLVFTMGIGFGVLFKIHSTTIDEYDHERNCYELNGSYEFGECILSWED